MENTSRDLRIDFPSPQPAMTSLSPALLDLMSRVIDGKASGEDLLRHIESLRSEALGEPTGTRPEHALTANAEGATEGEMERTCSIPGATVDLGRQARCGFGEVIYGEGKSAELVTRIIRTQLDVGQSALVTRIDAGVAFQVRQFFDFAHHNPLARTLRVSPTAVRKAEPLEPQQAIDHIHAAVVTAGSTDGPVAEEAIETLHWMGVPLQRFEDIGVAGPQRLAAALPMLRTASAVVVVAGMEGALPAVVAGHLSVPVFAVPTSVGYGANLGGLTTMLSMLNTCAAGVSVVNIDSGFKGGYLAGLVIRQMEQIRQEAP
jgi:NCAIR mutase (PurE)-related protein